MIKRKFLTMLLIAATVTNSLAAGNGMAGINEATSMVSSYFDPGTKLVYAIGAVVGPHRRHQGLLQMVVRRP